MLSLKQDVHSCLALLPKRLAEVMSTLLNQGSWGGQLRLYIYGSNGNECEINAGYQAHFFTLIA